MMNLVTDMSIVNSWLALLGFLGALMLAIGNIVLFPPPVQSAVQDLCPAKRAPIYTRGDLWG